jgi:hypothetical protein
VALEYAGAFLIRRACTFTSTTPSISRTGRTTGQPQPHPPDYPCQPAARADANKQRSITGPESQERGDPAAASRAVKEYLATLDDAPFGAASEVMEVHLAIRSRRAMDGSDARRGVLAYADNYLVDVKFGVIVDVKPRAPFPKRRLAQPRR